MTDIRDLTIKIFGTTIPLHEERIIRIDSGEKSDHSSIIDATDDKEECGESLKEESQNEIHMQCGLEDTSCKHENKEDGHLSEHNNELDTENAKKEANQTVADSVQGNKTLKKPDKVLPCPRCNSLDTKFCYFNNYNVSQPRHFCKKCQRYWTDGGTMRNVPVGAGRRKSKHSSSHHRQIVVSSDGVPPTHIDTRNSSTHHQKTSVIPKSGNGTILQFGPDGILCETVASVINLKDENRKMDHLKPVNCPKNVDQSSHVSYSSSTSHQEMKESPQKDDDSRNSAGPPPLQFYSGPSWALPWNPMWGPTAPIASPGSSEVVCRSDNNNTNSIQWEVPSIVAVPPFCATNMPIPIMPTAYWSCMPGWIPWVAGPNGNHSLSSPTSNKALGKRHSRGGSENVSDDNDEEVKQEKSIWIPKSIRMDEADEALKSCIWDTLGINHDQNEQTSRSCGIFKAFQPKTGVKSITSVSNQVLLANPSALARSRAFQESN